jgi:hypothetical protein
MSQKTIYMALGGNNHQEEKETFSHKMKEMGKDKIKDTLQDQLMDNISLVHLGGGMAQITLPLEMVKLIATLFKTLENQIDGGIER